MIKYKKRISQIIDFSGIGNSKIHPTDLDAILEFDEKYLIIFEVKKVGVDCPIGQRLVFERLVNSWEKTNGPAYLIYCEHNTSTDEIVEMTNCYTKKIYRKGKEKPYEGKSVLQVLHTIADTHKIIKLKSSLNPIH
jgi:hypothetical protein